MSRLRNIPGAREAVRSSEWVIQNPESRKGTWKKLFKNNDNPLHIEIGMGKGRFIMDMAEKYPEINFIGLERYESVLIKGIQKAEERRNSGKSLDNILFLAEDATNLPLYFDKEEIDRIYLNFSDPWPKDRHAKRRLTSSNFLNIYDKILSKKGRIEFKTDNELLFNFSVSEVDGAGWKLDAITRDLHNDIKMNEGNVMTEYEEKFSARGNVIYKYIISRK